MIGMANSAECRRIALCFAGLLVCSPPAASHRALATTAVASSRIVQGPTAEQHIQKAREAISAGRYGDAKRELKLALSLDKKSAAAHLCLASVHKNENNVEDGIDAVETAIKLQPQYPDAHYLFAELLLEKNELVKARREIDLAISQGASFRNAHILSGNIYLAGLNYQSALDSYEKALRLSGPEDNSEMLRQMIGGLANNIAFASHRGDPSYVKPQQLNTPRTEYTSEARNRGVQGKVVCRVLVTDQGRVSYIFVTSGLGYGLTESAIKATKELRFRPAAREGKPVSYWLTVLMEFNLRR